MYWLPGFGQLRWAYVERHQDSAVALVEGSSSVDDDDDAEALAEGRALRRKEVAMDDWAVDSRGASRDVVDPAKEESEGIDETGSEGVLSRRGVVLMARDPRVRGARATADRQERGEKMDMVPRMVDCAAHERNGMYEWHDECVNPSLLESPDRPEIRSAWK